MGIKRTVKKITDNAYVFSVITKIISVVLIMVYSILYSRYMGAELKGVGDVIHNYSEMLKLVMCLGIYQAYPFFKKQSGDNIYAEFINLVSGMFFLYTVIDIAIIILFRPNIEMIVVIVLIPIMFAIQQFNYIVLIEKPKIRNISQLILDCIDIFVVAVLIVAVKASYSVCLIYLVLRQIIYLIVGVIALNFNILRIRPSLKCSVKYIRYGFLPMLTIVMMEINYKADVLMLEWLHITKAEIGIYTLGITLAQKIWLIPDALKDILLSKLANGKKCDEVARITRMSLLIVVFFALLFALVGKPIIHLLYGLEFIEAYNVIVVLIIGIIGMVFYKMVYSYNVVNGKRVVNLILLGIAAIANIVFNLFLIPNYGILGAGIASTVSYFVCGLCFLIYFCKETDISYRDMILIKKNDIALFSNLLRTK